MKVQTSAAEVQLDPEAMFGKTCFQRSQNPFLFSSSKLNGTLQRELLFLLHYVSSWLYCNSVLCHDS